MAGHLVVFLVDPGATISVLIKIGCTNSTKEKWTIALQNCAVRRYPYFRTIYDTIVMHYWMKHSLLLSENCPINSQYTFL